MTTERKCQSCHFGAGLRTGQIRTVTMLETVGDWAADATYELCDDCLSHGDPTTFNVAA